MYIDWAEYDQKDKGEAREMEGNRKREMGMERAELLQSSPVLLETYVNRDHH